MRVLVTGANGFIGQHLVRALLDAGHHVRGMYNVKKPLYFFQKDEIEWFKADLTDPTSMVGVGQNINLVYHLAAIPRNDKSLSWEDYKAQNITGTETLLRECESSGVNRFVYVSSVEAAGYGDGINPRTETDNPSPDNNYGKSKLIAEGLVLGKNRHIECVVIRLPMIYGPGSLLVVPKLFGFVTKGFYPLIGDGKTLMEFCYVGNAANALILAGEHEKAKGELFYVSDLRSYTIEEVITHVAKSMNVRVRLFHFPVLLANCIACCWEILAFVFPFPPITSKYSKKPFITRETVRWTTSNVNCVSTNKIRDLLGYHPEISIDTGCNETATWLKAQSILK